MDAVAMPGSEPPKPAAEWAVVHGGYTRSADLRQLRGQRVTCSVTPLTDSPPSVDRDDLALGQRAHAMRAVERCDLAHHGVDFTRLDVSDEDVGRVFQARQFLAERRWAQVTADARKLALLVAERRLDRQRGDAHAMQARPQRRVGPGVA